MPETYRDMVNARHEERLRAQLEGVELGRWDEQNLAALAAAWDQKTVNLVCDLLHRVRVAAAWQATMTDDGVID